jgi:hypothetical protein
LLTLVIAFAQSLFGTGYDGAQIIPIWTASTSLRRRGSERSSSQPGVE